MTTLTDLTTWAQQEADMVNSSFVSSAEWTNYINKSYQELYGLVVQAYGNDYNVASPYSFTTDGTSYLFALPAGLFKLLGVDLQVQASGLWVTLRPFTFTERNRFGFASTQAPMAGQTLRLWYVPTLTALSAGGDAIIAPLSANGWDEYIVIDAAMKAMAKEESDTSVLGARKAAMLQRLTSEAENRDAGSPARIADVYNAVSPSMQYRLSGSNLWLIGGNTPAVPYGADWGMPW